MVYSCTRNIAALLVNSAVTFSFLLLAGNAWALEVGSTKGEFSVSGMGSASYAVPIEFPAGIAGMTPSLALNYSSQGGNGPVGQGWTISGFSKIARCAAKLEPDGYNRGVLFDDNDRLCLDGQRLVLFSGTYGKSGSEYRTELESFSRIRLLGGNSSSSNSYFEVMTKSGITHIFGNNSGNSNKQATHYLPGNSKPYLWATSLTKDTSNNQIHYRYLRYASSGEQLLAEIWYGPAANRSLYRAKLRYDSTRQDSNIDTFLYGSKLRVTKRLNLIQVYSAGAETRRYKLTYKNSQKTKAPLLTSLQECRVSACKPATTYTWDTPNNPQARFKPAKIALNSQATHNFDASSHNGQHESYIDMDGDGLTDKIWIPRGRRDFWIAKSNGNGFSNPVKAIEEFPSPGVRAHSNSGRHEHHVDINADGYPDLVWLPEDNDDLWVAEGNGQRYVNARRVLNSANYPSILTRSHEGKHETYADINGDGYLDRLWVPGNADDLWVAKWTGNGFSQPTVALHHNNSKNVRTRAADDGAHSQYLDINGDGMADKVWRPDNRAELWAAYSNGNSFGTPFIVLQGISVTGVDAFSSLGARQWFGDVNGDGITDYVWVPHGQANVYMALGDGRGFQLPKLVLSGSQIGLTPSSLHGRHNHLADINGDGRSDYVWIPEGTGEIRIALSDGVKFGQVRKAFATNPAARQDADSGKHEAFVDLNGDGLRDYLWVPVGKNQLWAGVVDSNGTAASDSTSERIIKITSGYGAVTEITYKSQSSPFNSIYTKDANQGYPYINYCSPIYVVEKFRTSNGRGGWAGSSYRYGGGKVQIRGRGLLGHRWLEVTDNQSGMVERTEYNQDFPLTGKPKYSQLKTAAGQLVSRVDNIYETFTLGSGINKRYFVSAKTQTETNYELSPNYHAVKTTRTTTTFNNTNVQHGNVTSTKTETWAGSPANYGNQLHSVLTRNWYFDAPGNAWADKWLLGRLSRTEVTHSAPGTSNITRKSTFAYHAQTGLLSQERIEPNTAQELKTTHYRDAFGNTVRKRVEGPGIATRESKTFYDSYGRFQTSSQNALGHQEYYQYDQVQGVRTRLTGPNGLATTWQYDVFGRSIKETRADGTHTQTFRENCSSSTCPVSGSPHVPKFRIRSRSSDGAEAYVVYDQLERKIAEFSKGFAGKWIRVFHEYDAQGRLQRESTPHYLGRSTCWISSSFDLLDRAVQVNMPISQHQCSGRITQTQYNGLRVTQIDPNYNSSINVNDVLGRTISVTDAAGGQLNHQYDAMGRLAKTTDAAGNVITMAYDLRGNKISMSDPDMGTWSYSYNALDQLVSQTDAKGQTVTMEYDLLGRMTKRSELEGISLWTYDSRWKGALTQVTAPEGYSRSMNYDNLGRVTSTHTVIDGTTYVSGLSYDNQSRVVENIYPSGIRTLNSYHPTHGYLTEVRDGSDYSLYWKLDNADALGNVDMWTLGNGISTTRPHDQARGHITSIMSGAGSSSNVQSLDYQWDLVGNLTSRTDQNQQGLAETFEYDDLYRLTRSRLNGSQNLHLVYDAIGNIVSKSGVGTYSYGSKPHAVSSVSGTRAASYQYDANGNLISGDDRTVTWTSFNKPQKITKLAGQSQDWQEYEQPETNPTLVHGDNRMFVPTDDVDGNFRVWWSKPSSLDPWALLAGNPYRMEIQYAPTNTFKNPITKYTQGHIRYLDITDLTPGTWFVRVRGNWRHNLSGNTANSGWFAGRRDITVHGIPGVTNTAEFSYGPDRARYKQVITKQDTESTETTTIHYLGNYEVHTTSALSQKKHFIQAGGQVIAIEIQRSNGSDSLHYLHRDHLGSVDRITDLNGNIVERNSYDAFGKRRSGNWQPDYADALLYNADVRVIDRGFTGHEHLDHVGLIHMNGRVYDPMLGRFLSADPNVQFPDSTQGTNRYTYVNNNPLSYTDPSGFFIKGLVKALMAPQLAFNLIYVDPLLKRSETARLIGGAIVSAASIPLGALGPLASAGYQAYVTELTGGSFGDVLEAGAVTAAMGYASYGVGQRVTGLNLGPQLDLVVRAISHGVTQGLISEATGGSFDAGFLSGSLSSVAGDLMEGWNVDGFGGQFAKVAVAAAVGGTASKLGGGKFANGAMTGAFVQAFNHAQEKQEPGFFERFFERAGDSISGFLENPGAHLPSLPQGVVDFSAGLGDGILLGQGSKLRNLLGVDGGVDPTSAEYGVGYASGYTVTSALVTRNVSLGFRSRGPFRVINQNRYLRMGYGSHAGRSTFRLGGRVIEKTTGRKHIDLGDGGSL